MYKNANATLLEWRERTDGGDADFVVGVFEVQLELEYSAGWSAGGGQLFTTEPVRVEVIVPRDYVK